MSRTMLVEYLGGTWPVLPLNIPRMLRYEPLWTTKTATQRIIRRRDLLTPDLKLHNNTSSAISPDGRRPFPEAGIRYARTAYSHYGKSSNHCQTHLTDYKTNADSPFCWTPHFLPQNRHFTPSPAPKVSPSEHKHHKHKGLKLLIGNTAPILTCADIPNQNAILQFD